MIEEAITEHWGERCDEYLAGCPTCDAWLQYDSLVAKVEENKRLRVALVRIANDFGADHKHVRDIAIRAITE